MFGSNNIMSNNPTAETLYILRKSQFVFHLTGSRFFGNHTSESDYDFFTKNNPEVRKFLIDEGFASIGSDEDYAGFNFEAEEALLNNWSGGLGPTPPPPISNAQMNPNNVAEVLRRGKVDVQLVDNPELKLKLQDILRKYGVMTSMIAKGITRDKKRMVDFWNMLYEVASLRDSKGGASHKNMKPTPEEVSNFSKILE